MYVLGEAIGLEDGDNDHDVTLYDGAVAFGSFSDTQHG